jgi:hypothetical protein
VGVSLSTPYKETIASRSPPPTKTFLSFASTTPDAATRLACLPHPFPPASPPSSPPSASRVSHAAAARSGARWRPQPWRRSRRPTQVRRERLCRSDPASFCCPGFLPRVHGLSLSACSRSGSALPRALARVRRPARHRPAPRRPCLLLPAGPHRAG